VSCPIWGAVEPKARVSVFNLNLSLQLNITSSRDRSHGMDKWLKEEIEAAKKRRERKEFKLSRRQLDAQVIAAGKEKFWSALVAALQSAIKEFNDVGVSDGPIAMDEKDLMVWIRTPGYPSIQLFLEFRDGMNDILFSLGRHDTPSSTLTSLLKETLDFDVNDDGHLMLRDNGSLMDVSRTTEYLMRMVLPIIHSGRY
jgi:hypothetical protein